MYISIFTSAFLAATILPAQSEALLAYHIAEHREAVIGLLIIATIGNVLGSVVNWGLGLYCIQYRDKKWFPVSAQQLAKAQSHYQKYGRYSLLLSWVPFIGDPITIAAGMMRAPITSFIILVTIAKASRYIVIAMLVLNIFG